MNYAYVTILYGNNIYLTGALVLGYSLKKTKTNHDIIILVTPDVSEEYKEYLKKFYKIIDINYIKLNDNLFEKERFKDVFTKLECLKLIQYDKIILLDLDMIIVKNIDKLFKLSPPAAVLKHNYVPYGQKISSKMICNNNKLINTINAGLMLLEPNINEYENIKKDINNTMIKYKFPEQEYLSLRYCNKWTSITFNYNYQFGLTGRIKKHKYKINDIYVIHYSNSFKPWNFFIKKIDNIEEKQFIEEHINYYNLWKSIYDKIISIFKKDNVILPYR